MKPIVLIISNIPELIAKNVTILESNGFNTIISSNLQRAKKRICLFPPHCLIVFYKETNGIIEELRQSLILKDLPVLMFASNDDFFIAQDSTKHLNIEVLNVKEDGEKVLETIRKIIEKYMETPKIVLRNKKIKIRMKVEITEINEAGFSFFSEVKFRGVKVYPVRSRFFVKLGFNPPFASLKEDPINKNLCMGSFIGLKEDERTSIREWINSKLTRQN